MEPSTYAGYRTDVVLLPQFSVRVPAPSNKVLVRDALKLLYQQLHETGDVFEMHVMGMLKEDISARAVLRRNLMPFIVANDKEPHLGHIKAIAMLEEDEWFVIRLKKEMFVLWETPTDQQVREIKDNLLALE